MDLNNAFPELPAQVIAQTYLASMAGSRLARRWLRTLAGPTGPLPALTYPQYMAVGRLDLGVSLAFGDLYPLPFRPPRHQPTPSGKTRLAMLPLKLVFWLVLMPVAWTLPKALRLVKSPSQFDLTFGHGEPGAVARARTAAADLAAAIAPVADELVERWRQLPPLSDGSEWLAPLEALAEQVADVALATANGDLYLAVRYLSVCARVDAPRNGVRRQLTNRSR